MAAGGLVAALYVAHTPTAHACGCFTPPDPSVPIVQSGENILFDIQDGVVTSHIQIQYSGPAEEFGWLLPLPSVPTMELGTDELFAQLISQTQPKYRLDRRYVGNCPFDPARGGGGFGSPTGANDSAGDPGSESGDGNVLVLRDSVGPYDYAVLRADSKEPMFTWLAENRFYVPAGTEGAVDPYIRPGAYFLALKLRKGQDTGDLQPVVVKYESDLPMIPIVLTSVAADPDMGVLVWVLGDSRAIPRNYYHTMINDAKIDWINFGANYVDVITKAVDEAEGHRSFVTEYAGTSSIMVDVLDYSWRFGDLNELRTKTDAVDYVQYLTNYGWGVQVNNPPVFGIQFSSQILSLLQRELPVPQGLLDQGVTANDYYVNIGYYLGWYKEQNPELYTDLDVEFDPVQLTNDLEERVVKPTRAAGQMFRDNPYMTRMFTTLSPEEMTRDPVFSFNPDLPAVSNVHSATLTYFCDDWGTNTEQGKTPALLETESGWQMPFPGGTDYNPWEGKRMPFSMYTQVLREEGQPETVDDRSAEIRDALEEGRASSGGCSLAADNTRGGFGMLLLLGLVIGFSARRRRRK
jgi:hypothetical protein